MKAGRKKTECMRDLRNKISVKSLGLGLPDSQQKEEMSLARWCLPSGSTWLKSGENVELSLGNGFSWQQLAVISFDPIEDRI